MMYKDLGGIPIFQDIATNLTSNGFQFLNPFMMLLLYFLSFNIIYFVCIIIKKISNILKIGGNKNG